MISPLITYLECDLTPVLGHLHEGEQLHLADVVLVLEPEPVHKLFVALVEADVGLQLLADEDAEQVVDQLALQELDRLQLQQMVQQEGVRVCTIFFGLLKNRFCGSGSVRIRINLSYPDPYKNSDPSDPILSFNRNSPQKVKVINIRWKTCLMFKFFSVNVC